MRLRLSPVSQHGRWIVARCNRDRPGEYRVVRADTHRTAGRPMYGRARATELARDLAAADADDPP